jgi:hypothetical protein
MDVELGGLEVLRRTHALHVRRGEHALLDDLIGAAGNITGRVGLVLDGLVTVGASGVGPRICRDCEFFVVDNVEVDDVQAVVFLERNQVDR